MFRYTLNPRSCKWEIQLLRFGCIWVTMRGICFGSLEGAKDFAEKSGISIHYQEQRPFNHTPVTAEQEIPQ